MDELLSRAEIYEVTHPKLPSAKFFTLFNEDGSVTERCVVGLVFNSYEDAQKLIALIEGK